MAHYRDTIRTQFKSIVDTATGITSTDSNLEELNADALPAVCISMGSESSQAESKGAAGLAETVRRTADVTVTVVAATWALMEALTETVEESVPTSNAYWRQCWLRGTEITDPSVDGVAFYSCALSFELFYLTAAGSVEAGIPTT